MDDKLYFETLDNIKSELTTARNNAIISANEQMIKAYFNIGKKLIENDKWGTKFIETLAKDLKLSFPKIKGLSARNLRYMKKLALTYSECEILQHPVAKLSWRSNLMLLDKLKTNEERLWYANKAIENNWSSTVLDHQIATKLINRQGDDTKKVTNFLQKLDDGFSERVQEVFKDPYFFDFMTYQENILEKQVEEALVTNITNLLMELGKGFAFVGKQHKLTVGDKDFYIDLLFYNIDLKCYVVIELKTKEFIPEYTGKLSFYLSAVDGLLRKANDNPTIGILLTRGKNNLIAEFALKETDAPIGVADYKFMQEIPDYLREVMPSIADIEKRIKDQEVNQDCERMEKG